MFNIEPAVLSSLREEFPKATRVRLLSMDEMTHTRHLSAHLAPLSASMTSARLWSIGTPAGD